MNRPKILFYLLLFGVTFALLPMKRKGSELVSRKKTVKKLKTENPASENIAVYTCLPLELQQAITILVASEYHQSPKELHRTLCGFNQLNKAHNKIINNPKNICSIINNLCYDRTYYRSIICALPFSAIKKYQSQSISLRRQIPYLNPEEIKKLVYQGADVNYCNTIVGESFDSILFKTKRDYTKTELLLSLGADPTIMRYNSSPMHMAMRTDMQLFTLYAAYASCKNYLIPAIQTNKPAIVQIVLDSKTIPQAELDQGLFTALHTLNQNIIEQIIQAGANPDGSICQAIDLLHKKSSKLSQSQISALIDIIDLLCKHDRCIDLARKKAYALQLMFPQLHSTIEKNTPRKGIRIIG